MDSPPMSPSLLYLKPLRNINTFLHVIYKSKKKTNLLCILNNVFQYSKIRTRKRNAKKSIKTEKRLESSPFWNPESTELESGIQYSESRIHRVESRVQDCHGFPYMGRVIITYRVLAAPVQANREFFYIDCMTIYLNCKYFP